MLKRIFKSRLLMAILAAAIIPFAGIVSCESDSDNSDEGYYISFTVDDGTKTSSYKFEKMGDYAEIESDVPACIYSTGIQYDSEAYNTTDTADHAHVFFEDSVGEGDSFTEVNGGVNIYIEAISADNYFGSNVSGGSCSGKVTEIGEVGGIVSGTFSGTLVLFSGSGTDTKSITVANGKFRVKRIAEFFEE